MNLVAIMSVPRLGWTDFYGHAPALLAKRGIGLEVITGVFWGACLQNGIKKAFADGADGVITIDYDSMFKGEDIDALVRLILAYPEADAICPVQNGRFKIGVLANREDPVQAHELMREIVPIDGGHFGFTFLRKSAVESISLPWFHHSPNDAGDYDTGKVDDDQYFWNKFKAAGKTLCLAPHITIGHLELMVKWPDKQFNPLFQHVQDFHEHGRPDDAWI